MWQRSLRAWRGASLCGVLLTLVALGSGEIKGRAVASGSGPAPAKVSASLLLVTIDTWRWDYIGASGARKVETPNLDQLAREGVYEPEAITPCPLTTPAHASLLTGVGPQDHGIWDCTMYQLAPEVPTLAEAFRDAGYKTAAFVSSETLRQRYGLGRGFEIYDDSGLSRRGQGDWMAPCRDGKEVTGAFLKYIGTLVPGQKAFVWLHYFDLHLPYRPRAGLDDKYPRDHYAAQAAYVDGQVGVLLKALHARPGRQWRVVVVGDHGEGLGEKGEDTHGIGLYRATLHVPLVIHPRPERPIRLPKPWGLIDLSPTLREWFGLPAARKSDGQSLFQREGPDRALFAVSAEPALLFAVEPPTGVRQGHLQYLRSGREELFDQKADPAQVRDLTTKSEFREDLNRLRGVSNKAWKSGWVFAALPPSLTATSEDFKKLQSLGYVGGEAPPRNKIQRADIRDVMKDRSDWDKAREEAFRTKKNDSLLALYSRLVAKYPNSLSLRNWYGPLLARTGRTQEALRQMEQAVRLAPQDSAALSNLGTLYLQAGRIEAAKNFLESALKQDPNNKVANKELGILYADHLDRPKDAIAHYQKYLSLGGDADAEAVRNYIRNHSMAPRQGPPK